MPAAILLRIRTRRRICRSLVTYVRIANRRRLVEPYDRPFEAFGTVVSAHVVRDGSGQSLNFGFVEMGSRDEAQQAVAQLNGQELEGHPLTVLFVTEGTSF
jgi:hypothetical protein